MKGQRKGPNSRLLVLFAVIGSLGLAWVSWISSSVDAAPPEDADGRTRAIEGIEYPVNEKGLTYGAEHEVERDGQIISVAPDLVPVRMPDYSTGYMYYEDFYSMPPVSSPEEAVEWMEAGQPMESKPIYKSDGETQIGWWVSSEGKREAEVL